MRDMSWAEKVTIECFGGCGRSVSLRKSKVRRAQYYLCHSKEHGHLCHAKLPSLPPGMIRCVEIDAAASFWGYTDERPDVETAASLQRAKGILAIGMVRRVVERAQKSR
jgi:hypothetical protein